MLPFPSGLFAFMFTVIPIIVIGGFIYVIGSAIFRAVNNSQQPLLTRYARVVGRREEVSHSHHDDHHSSSTAYFITFEFQDGNREEFSLRGDQYAMLAEGDIGTLQSQGTWFKGFDREMSARSQ